MYSFIALIFIIAVIAIIFCIIRRLLRIIIFIVGIAALLWIFAHFVSGFEIGTLLTAFGNAITAFFDTLNLQFSLPSNG